MTMQELTTASQREMIGKLTALAARRDREEEALSRQEAADAEEAVRRQEKSRQQAAAAFAVEHARTIAEYKAAREAVFLACEQAGCTLAQEEDQESEAASVEHVESRDAVKNLRQQRTEAILTTFKEREVVPRNEFAQFRQQCEHKAGELSALVVRAQSIVRARCPWPEEEPPAPSVPPGLSATDYCDRLSAAMGRAHHLLSELQHQPAARFLEEGWLILLFVAVVPAAAGLLWAVSLTWLWVAVGSLAFATATTAIARQIVFPFARSQTLRVVPHFKEAVSGARALLAAALTAARADAEAEHRRIVQQRDDDLAAAKAEYHSARREQKARYKNRLAASAAAFAARRKAVEDRFQEELAQVAQKYPTELAQLEEEFERKMVQLSESFRAGQAAARDQSEHQRRELSREWTEAVADLEAAIGEMNRYCRDHCRPWQEVETTAGEHLPTPRETGGPANGPADLAAIRFGQFDFQLPDGSARLQLPAVLSYPDCPSLLFEAEAEGRGAAMRAMQNVMLRLATSFPPGKVRFTIIDPVGLGQNFSAFMHLADYDERLVANRIWTEAAHIHQRLADLTEHMENVIQKYLRNEFASIQEYNRHAGEVAEPFQILVVANFPANFSEEAARRLVSIASSGARCGVYTLISIDGKLKLPRNFDLADLESRGATLVWDESQGRFAWKDEALRSLPLTLDEPPDDERFTAIIREVGKRAKDASRVEVPFESVAPAAGSWWSSDSRSAIEVPLGRAGATKHQFLRLGHGTSQHVLIAGKTGSGKSTLLNAMITNLALHYSPQELEFYLIDFKKGVEFKAYASQRLPHARVIAIESEREFGMSVLARLDEELKRRGDLLRKAGVQDVKGFRNAQPQTPLPRILLVIDEFQEFFTSDDKIAHDAALLLDRLVRQGRAFGIHVLLGSQTLAGAYSLARSTIGQMAVRIALQCSESDAHLILSEDNTAARLLSRPGEAIYNDANGLFEGNHPFQVVWLPDQQREEYLRQLAALAIERDLMLPPPTVFEGNVAADVANNIQLRRLIEAGPAEAGNLAPRAWLGDAVAIKEPTAVVFRRQSGSNLVLVGQQEELALGILYASVVSLAAQSRPSAEGLLRTMYVLDGARPDSSLAGFWRRACGEAGLDVQVETPRSAAAIVGQIAEEVERRLSASEHSLDSVFLVIYNLARFRDLKKGDDFSFDEGTSAGKQLATILRDGPAVGIHALLWSDSYSTLQRWLDRQAIKDLEMRVLMQMGAADSSNLMDSPAASRLTPHTAIFFSEAQGEAEKFRPYAAPTARWLTWVAEQFAEKVSTSLERNRAATPVSEG